MIRGPLTPLVSERNKLIEKGVIERALDFVYRNMNSAAWIDGGRRNLKKAYLIEAPREAVVNAVMHRDYS